MPTKKGNGYLIEEMTGSTHDRKYYVRHRREAFSTKVATKIDKTQFYLFDIELNS